MEICFVINKHSAPIISMKITQNHVHTTVHPEHVFEWLLVFQNRWKHDAYSVQMGQFSSNYLLYIRYLTLLEGSIQFSLLLRKFLLHVFKFLPCICLHRLEHWVEVVLHFCFQLIILSKKLTLIFRESIFVKFCFFFSNFFNFQNLVTQFNFKQTLSILELSKQKLREYMTR